MNDFDDIHGNDPLDEALDKHGITADKLISDLWRYRNQFKQIADKLIPYTDMDKPDINVKEMSQALATLVMLSDKIEDRDKELRRLSGLYSKDNEQSQGTFTLIQEIPKDK
jgi:hypothetical protein